MSSPRMPVHAIRIEARLWSSASPLRRQEWRTITTDMVSGDPPWPSREPCTLIAGHDEGHLHFIFSGGSRPDDALAVARADIAPLVSEYADLIKRLSGGDLQAAHIEALDMAKRVVHDAGARQIGALLPDLSPSFETRRRFFSLVVSLIVDTTRLGPLPAHLHDARRAW
ncbi:UPF0262 family protein [Sorangium sp. So ce1335]|uniref:UPF0262 family protein n=1 Tax=Sorangium sp. So ce1335 TaxID=3133335 RepID=UPI003F5DDEC6